MNTINETFPPLDHEHIAYIKWRREVIERMIRADNLSTCLNAMNSGIQLVGKDQGNPQSIHEAVNRDVPGKTIGDLTPIIESDGTPDLSQS